jgi:hypothetical protein
MTVTAAGCDTYELFVKVAYQTGEDARHREVELTLRLKGTPTALSAYVLRHCHLVADDRQLGLGADEGNKPLA